MTLPYTSKTRHFWQVCMYCGVRVVVDEAFTTKRRRKSDGEEVDVLIPREVCAVPSRGERHTDYDYLTCHGDSPNQMHEPIPGPNFRNRPNVAKRRRGASQPD